MSWQDPSVSVVTNMGISHSVAQHLARIPSLSCQAISVFAAFVQSSGAKHGCLTLHQCSIQHGIFCQDKFQVFCFQGLQRVVHVFKVLSGVQLLALSLSDPVQTPTDLNWHQWIWSQNHCRQCWHELLLWSKAHL